MPGASPASPISPPPAPLRAVSPPRPVHRRLRVFAFDPAAAARIDTAAIGDTVIALPWEQPWETPLRPGPVNDYLEVVDGDPTTGTAPPPVDLDAPWLLAQDGLPPAEGNPQFHQQMVFAVAMRTIRDFERALGRPVFWAPPESDADGNAPFLPRLRIEPHALDGANAFYSPARGALLFGSFRTPPRFAGDEGEAVFTCLSQDIVAHETTHAILHGLRRRSTEPSTPDSLAFHEGFADIVALLQHFTMEPVVAHELARSGGMLRSAGLLTGLAEQFGHATGHGGAMRMALDTLKDEAGTGHPAATLADIREPHARGQFLVTALFDAFITIWERRTRDLFRIAGRQPGMADLPDPLIARLAKEAGKTAQAVLALCVRGLDYLPPAAATFGDYLRAIITADRDVAPADPLHYRVALAESFRLRGIPVPGCSARTPAALCWEAPDPAELAAITGPRHPHPARLLADSLRGITPFARLTGTACNWRDEAMRVATHNQRVLCDWLHRRPPPQVPHWERLLGVRLDGTPFDAASVRIARRAGPDGNEQMQVIARIAQRRPGFLDRERQAQVDRDRTCPSDPRPDFWFRGGATLVIDLRDGRLRHVIRQRIDNDARLERQRAFLLDDAAARSLAARAPGCRDAPPDGTADPLAEPFTRPFLPPRTAA